MSKNPFGDAPKASDSVEEDFLGGGGLLETNLYPGTLKTVYLGKSARSESQSVTYVIALANGRELRETTWITTGAGSTTYKDKKTGKPKPMPSYALLNSAAMLLLGKEIGQTDVEEKVVKIYDFDAGKEVPKSVDCFVEFHGVEVLVAVQKVAELKQKKNDDGDYVDTDEVRELNTIVKFFDPKTRATISEVSEFIKTSGTDLDTVLEDGVMSKVLSKFPESSSVYADAWLEKNQGVTYDKTKGKGGNKSPGKSFEGSASKKEETKAKADSLFD